jgi:hypothetical protein
MTGDFVTPGRPRIGAPTSGPSPILKGRVSGTAYALFQELQTETSRSEADLVREAVQLLLERHQKLEGGTR